MEIYGMTGERLGTIGAEGAGENLPQWKRDLLSRPSISVRKGIARNYQAPEEDADVLVLTAPSSKFVDIRFPKDHSQSKSMTSHPAFWVFSGAVTTTFVEADGGLNMPYSAHCVWKHDVDSRGLGITDEGDMFLLPNGDGMEVGVMENPETGKGEIFKEYWTEPSGQSGAEGYAKLPCVVAETEASGQNARHGRIIRVGDHCQGVLESGAVSPDNVWAVRTASKHGNWTGDSRSRAEAFPCSWLCEDGRTIGDEIVHDGLKWKITEVVT